MAMWDPYLSSFVPHLEALPDMITNVKGAKAQIDRNNIAIGICSSVVTIFFLCRVYSRRRVQRVLVLEDCMFFLLLTTEYNSMSTNCRRACFSSLGMYYNSVYTRGRGETIANERQAGVIVYLGFMGATISKYKLYAMNMMQEDTESKVFYVSHLPSVPPPITILIRTKVAQRNVHRTSLRNPPYKALYPRTLPSHLPIASLGFL